MERNESGGPDAGKTRKNRGDDELEFPGGEFSGDKKTKDGASGEARPPGETGRRAFAGLALG